MTLTAPDVTFSVSPSNNQNAAKQRVDVGVETNVAGGAKLYLSMAGASNSLHLNGDTSQTTNVIAATTGTNGLDGFADNTWGYSIDDQTYSAVPTTASDPALLATIDGETTGTTSGSVISASIPVYYAAKVDTSIQPGSYSNRVTYSAVTDGGIVTSATLTKIEAGGVEVEELQRDEVNTLTVTTNLMVNSFGPPRVIYRTTDPSGYQECGNVLVQKNSDGYMTITCDVTPTQGATGITLEIIPRGSDGDIYCQDGTYLQGTNQCEEGAWKWGSFTVEVPDLIVPALSSIDTMQEMTSELCAAAEKGDTAQLTDTRDGKKYWVTKLPDGNCWMTQNLDLDLSTRTALTPADTNITSNWTPRASTTTSIASESYYTDTGLSYDPGNKYYENTSGTDSHYHAGNYYQWSTVTAGHTVNSQSDQSICPNGWTLPSQSQLQQLINSGLTFSNFMNSPYYLLRGGRINGSNLSYVGSDGYYWSSTPYNALYFYYLSITSEDGVSLDSIFDCIGASVRCVAAG